MPIQTDTHTAEDHFTNGHIKHVDKAGEGHHLSCMLFTEPFEVTVLTDPTVRKRLHRIEPLFLPYWRANHTGLGSNGWPCHSATKTTVRPIKKAGHGAEDGQPCRRFFIISTEGERNAAGMGEWRASPRNWRAAWIFEWVGRIGVEEPTTV